MKKIILANILIIFVLLVTFEVFSYFKYKSDNKYLRYSIKKEKFENKFKSDFKRDIRKPVGLEYKKKPILFLGCSYAYGHKLKEEQTISYQIFKKAKRPVYNWSHPAWGIQHAYYTVQNMPKIKPEPEYIFYIFIGDHLRRMFVNGHKLDYVENLQYKFKNGKLEKIDNTINLFDNVYFLYEIKNFFIMKVKFYKNYVFSEKSEKLFKDYVNTLKNEIKQIYPDSKFVFLLYDWNGYPYFPGKNIKDLEQEDIKVINLKELCNVDFSEDKYKLSKESDSFRHPNELAWNRVSDALIKEFDL